MIETFDIAKLREKLLANASQCPRELEAVQQLADTIVHSKDHELKALVPDAARAVRDLSRIGIKCVAIAAADTRNVPVLVALDDRLVPLLHVMGTFIDRLTLWASQEEKENGGDDDDAKALSHWLPFVLTACSFVTGADLPGAELMQCTVVAEKVLDKALLLVNAHDREALVTAYVAQMVALCAHDVDKQEWVAVTSIHKQVLLHVVEHVRFPHLGGDLLGRLLALTFPLVDDLTDSTQLIGAQLLRHIVQNVTPTELRWYSDVLLEVLHTAIVSRKPRTLDVLLDCLTGSLDKVSPPGELKHYDRFMPRLLSDTSLCSDVALRIVFVRHLRVLVVRQGAPHSLNIIRYLQPLLKVLVAGFESVNVALLVETLESVRATVLAAWPRIAPHTEQILVGLLRAVAFCELLDNGADFSPTLEQKEQVLALCEDSLDLLHQANASKGVVSDMLATVSNQSPKLIAVL
ncbi:unnamed protein product [Hyaloperonospora brassicae]|uniref:Uncharacterized protein n=1 Tax=Hyaloperonospora brassicae TaxID=162125 RepID=A0AAV0U9Z6_HYABA|nr:unnamed protein product [Hyaloperonospora brassicae]